MMLKDHFLGLLHAIVKNVGYEERLLPSYYYAPFCGECGLLNKDFYLSLQKVG